MFKDILNITSKYEVNIQPNNKSNSPSHELAVSVS